MMNKTLMGLARSSSFSAIGGIGGGIYGGFHGPQNRSNANRALGVMGWGMVGGLAGGLADYGLATNSLRRSRMFRVGLGRSKSWIGARGSTFRNTLTKAFNGFKGLF